MTGALLTGPIVKLLLDLDLGADAAVNGTFPGRYLVGSAPFEPAGPDPGRTGFRRTAKLKSAGCRVVFNGLLDSIRVDVFVSFPLLLTTVL